jgi:hypothetical protein
MMRLGSNLCQTATLSGLIMLTLLLLGAIVSQSAGPAEKDVQVIAVSEHSSDCTHTTPEGRGRVTLDVGVTDLRGALP